MGQIYEMTNEDINEIIDEFLQDNSELQEWVQIDERVREQIESIFYESDVENTENIHQDCGRNYYVTGKRASLYRRDSAVHICAKAMALDFLKIVFSPSVWDLIKGAYCNIKGIDDKKINAVDVIMLIGQIKQIVTQNVVKLQGEEFCFYLQMITHFREHQDVDVKDILDWLPEGEGECRWSAVNLECDFRKKGNCILKKQADYEALVRRVLNAMVKERVLTNNMHQRDKYKINY
ncbi:MAG: hypothetical protein NC249_12170 [Lachnoclostridium sp.]|nr:hypothetical protein [Lachnoclostridium sp.]